LPGNEESVSLAYSPQYGVLARVRMVGADLQIYLHNPLWNA
jgi:hypothetical protein